MREEKEVILTDYTDACVFTVRGTPPDEFIDLFEDDEFTYHVHVYPGGGATHLMWRLDEFCCDYLKDEALADYMAKHAIIERTYDWQTEC